MIGAPFGELHFDPAEFDGMLAQNGSPADLRFAMRCACWDDQTGEPDPACMQCFPFGWVWEAPQTVNVFGPNRKPTRRVDAAGTYDIGDAFFTLPSGLEPPRMSRLTMTLSTLTVWDALLKNKEDVIRFPTVLGIDRAWHSTRTPPSGGQYGRSNLDLTFSGATPDITVTGRQVTWNPANTLPDGTPYVVRFKTYAEYLVWEQQERNEGGRVLPSRFLCKRLDYYLHPRGTKEASY